jgi:hypothetical protein
MDVSVKKTSTGYEVTIKGEAISLPADSKMTESRRDASIRYGTPNKHLEFIQGGEVVLVNMGDRRILAEDDEGVDIAEQFAVAWSDPEEEESAPMAAPASKPAPEKKGFFKGILEKARGLAKKEAVEADNHAKEVSEKAKNVDKAIEEVEKKLRDLKSAAKKGSSRVNRKTRRSKGKRRYTKRR